MQLIIKKTNNTKTHRRICIDIFQRRHKEDQQAHEKMLNISGKCKSKPQQDTRSQMSRWLSKQR